MSKPTVYSWDSTVFIAWLSNDAGSPLSAIKSVVDEIEADKATFVVSVMAYSEILEAKHTKEQMEAFESLLKRSNIVLVETSIQISKKVQQIRSAGLAEGRKIKTPDATFLAVAIIYRVSALHSLDHNLLALNGHPIAEGIPIILPIPLSGQSSMF